jgi:hypothetical protein
VHLPLVGDVGLRDDGAPALGLDGLAGRLGALGVVEVVHGDVGALAGELDRGRPADARSPIR